MCIFHRTTDKEQLHKFYSWDYTTSWRLSSIWQSDKRKYRYRTDNHHNFIWGPIQGQYLSLHDRPILMLTRARDDNGRWVLTLQSHAQWPDTIGGIGHHHWHEHHDLITLVTNCNYPAIMLLQSAIYTDFRTETQTIHNLLEKGCLSKQMKSILFLAWVTKWASVVVAIDLLSCLGITIASRHCLKEM